MPLSLSAWLDNRYAGRPKPERGAFLADTAYAHRGLHGRGRVENSMGAFRAALAEGFGIELDVHMARDGQIIVFHDETLDRLTAETGPLADRTRAELAMIHFRDAPETIPALEEVLKLVAGRAPILIEVKAEKIRRVNNLCLAVRRTLEGYTGPVAVMSFNPDVSRWFHRHARKIVHGLVMTEGQEIVAGTGLKARFMRHAALWRAKPDFLAYDIRNLPSRFVSAQRKRGLPILTWTVRTGEQRQTAAANTDQIIFERLDK